MCFKRRDSLVEDLATTSKLQDGVGEAFLRGFSAVARLDGCLEVSKVVLCQDCSFKLILRISDG